MHQIGGGKREVCEKGVRYAAGLEHFADLIFFIEGPDGGADFVASCQQYDDTVCAEEARAAGYQNEGV